MTHAVDGMSPESPQNGSPGPGKDASTNTDSFPAVVADEHRYGGMLKGAEVIVRSTSWHGTTSSRGRILDFASVPAAHLTLLLTGLPNPGRKRIIFCSAIEYIDQV